MKLVAAVAFLGMVAAQHAGERGIDPTHVAETGWTPGGNPKGPGADDITPDDEEQKQFGDAGKFATDEEAQTDWQSSHAHGKEVLDRSDAARGNQWNKNQATTHAPKIDPSEQVHVKINGIMTKKVPKCQEPFIVSAITGPDTKIEDMTCDYPLFDPNDPENSCKYPLKAPASGEPVACEPLGPWCPHPLIYDTDAKECIPLVPRIGKGNAILNNEYIGAVLRQDGPDHLNKAPRAHQPTENDPNDNVMIKERHNEENHLWNWEKVRRHTGH